MESNQCKTKTNQVKTQYPQRFEKWPHAMQVGEG